MADFTLDEVLKNINKKFSDEKLTVAKYGVDEIKSAGVLSLGSPALDFVLYNSGIEGRMWEISGAEGSGKTTLSYLLASDYIRKELERNPEEPRKILFVDAECTADPRWALKSTGYDMNRQDVKTILIQPAGMTAEQIFDVVIDTVKTGEIGFIIFDSLTAIVSQQTFDESMEKKEMGGIAKPLGDFCKKITGYLNKFKTTFIGINGLTENISGYGEKEIVPGGRTWKRACSYRLRVKKGDFFDDEVEPLAKKDTEGKDAVNPSGNFIEVVVYKSKGCKNDRRYTRTALSYNRGIDLLYDTISTATLLGLIDNSTMGWYKILDPETGEVMLDSEGKELKIRGLKNVKPWFEEHKDVWKKLYDEVYKLMSVQDDPNVVSFEKMLGIDLQEKIGVDDINNLEEA